MFVVAAVWFVAAAVGLGLYYWWFHSINKTPAVFIVLVYLVMCIVAALIAAMVPDKPSDVGAGHRADVGAVRVDGRGVRALRASTSANTPAAVSWPDPLLGLAG